MRLLRAVVLVFFAACLPAWADDGIVGFVVTAVPNGTAAAIETALWYPAEGASVQPTRLGPFTQDLAPGAPVRGRALPLIVISHGSGSSFTGHVDTALALAQAGFIVAAPTHTGDNTADTSGARDIGARTRQFTAVIEHVVAGGTPDLGRVTAHCTANPTLFERRLVATTAALPTPPVVTRAARPLHALVVAALIVRGCAVQPAARRSAASTPKVSPGPRVIPGPG